MAVLVFEQLVSMSAATCHLPSACLPRIHHSSSCHRAEYKGMISVRKAEVKSIKTHTRMDLTATPATADVPGGVGLEESTVMQHPVSEMGVAAADTAAPAATEKEMRKMKVMVALDDSEGSFYALMWALDHLFHGRTREENDRLGLITAVHIQEPLLHYVFPAAGPGGTAFYASSAVIESVKTAQEENTALILSRAIQMCRERMVEAETLIMTGDPKDMICQATEEMQVDLLVIGSRGLGKIKRALLGSVSDYCTHCAKCPVLIIKPPKEVD
ncbi:hypothetical protein SAY87_027348 [Trapa incisa]|uniref:UspA domain-containing protein n=1 Tax=Trapa incisa TaxID=236973 RepID=A0AAN7GVY8_9MYRT|nr:hypothetical protein SAY87_027348 [Trapa incisa]